MNRRSPTGSIGTAALALLLVAACQHAPPSSGEAANLASVTLWDLDGGHVSLGEGGDEILVVAFFAVWCAPCLDEVPYLTGLHRRPGIRVVGISMDERGPKILVPFRRDFQVEYPILLSDAAIQAGRSPFGPLPGIPVTFILSRDRQIEVGVLGQIQPEKFDRLIHQALARPRPGTRDAGTSTPVVREPSSSG